MTKGTKIVLIIAAVCIVLSIALFAVAAMIGGANFKEGIETELFGVSVHLGDDGFYAGPSADIQVEGVENSAEFTEKVDAFDINWTSGTVKFEFGGDKITVCESSSVQIENEDAMACSVENGTLKISYYAPRVNFIDFGESVAKNLTVTIPENLVPEIKSIRVGVTSADVTLGDMELKNLNIDSTSGSAFISNVTADSFVFDSTSGNLTAENCSLGRMGIHTTSGCALITDVTSNHAGFDVISGDVTAKNCEFGKVEAESTSGSFSMSLNNVPKEFDADTTSGDVEILLPEDAEFTLEFDPTSGDLNLEFAAIMRGDEYIVGNSKNEISIETTSGDAYIRIK